MADKPSLRFADGGSLITRWARSVMRPDATANRLRQAESPTPTPAAPPPPPPKVQDPSRVTADNPAGIRFQDGGVVPGKGKGDKIPAKYEPGEFVVSNDMIDDNPGLRKELSSLRAETLARRGKTVVEADAGIVTPKGLRAADGFDPFDRMARTLTGQNATPPRSPMGATAQDLGRGPIGAGADPARAPAQGPTNPNVGQGRASAEAQAWQRGRTAVQSPLPPTMADKARATLRNTWDEFRGAPKMGPSPKISGMRKAANTMGKGAAGLGGAVAVGMEAKDVYDVAVDPNSTKTDVVEQAGRGATKLATSAMGAKAGAMAGSLGGPFAPVTVPLGGVIGGIAGYYGGDKLIGGLREAAGLDPRTPEDRLQAQAKEQGPAPTAAPTKPAAPTNYRGKGYDDPRRVDMDPSRQSLGDSRDFSKELAGLPGKMPGGMREGMIYKTTDENGRTVYSGTNVREGAGFVDGMGANIGSRGNVSTVPGMSQAQIDATLTNPDGSRWSANDNAIMAANLRDGVDPYRGTSRGAAAAGGNQFQAPQNELYDGGGFGLLSNRARNERSLKMDAEQLKPGARTALKAFYEGEKEHRKNQTDVQKTAMTEDGALKRTAMTDGTTRRGQDMELQGKRLDVQGRYAAENAKMLREAQMREAQAQIWNEAKQDPIAARDMALRYGFGDMAKSFGELATSDQSRAKASSDRGVSRLESRAVDEDGNISDGAKAIVRAQANSMAPGYETMQPHEQDQHARDVLAGIDVMQGMNQTRDPSFLNMAGNLVGLAGRSDMITSLPELKGAEAEKVGFWEGITTARVGKGDMKLLMPDGTERFIPRNKVDQDTKELLRARGVTFKD